MGKREEELFRGHATEQTHYPDINQTKTWRQTSRRDPTPAKNSARNNEEATESPQELRIGGLTKESNTIQSRADGEGEPNPKTREEDERAQEGEVRRETGQKEESEIEDEDNRTQEKESDPGAVNGLARRERENKIVDKAAKGSTDRPGTGGKEGPTSV
ncbi:hypothetical protein C922_05099 [Plasmodium inui San Antonio 1]|uniref:Uncharacterized protein n=1 Tax=Plasmodium inui San Antonio 1 TaxID=1237626 RepID=W6ZUW5_9APIC|nr:hypothetical protein C922_05099 [Plasmodium inui San Antonio 1]EUD64537.1 hypothetical protein C922_05099 [Plasmodium inui San Antonio 1]